MKYLLGTLLLTAWATGAWASSGGPPDARTGAPGETTCTACHTTFPLNSGTGSLSVSGVSGGWLPNQEYVLTVSLSDPDAMRWGYEFTILDGTGVSVGQLALVGGDGDSQLSTTGMRDYAKHTAAGTQQGVPGSTTWQMLWTAPGAPVGPITIYLAGNAANNNGSNSGDRIYNASEIWPQALVSGTDLPNLAEARLHPNHPNPFNPRTTIVYELPRDAPVSLAIYALDGSLVRRLVNGFESAGRREVTWDGLNQRGRAASSGVYLYRLVADGVVSSRRMTLVR